MLSAPLPRPQRYPHLPALTLKLLVIPARGISDGLPPLWGKTERYVVLATRNSQVRWV